MNMIYKPDSSLMSKVNRKLVRFQSKRTLPLKLDRSIVSFSFDDCPKSVLSNALVPIEAEGWAATIYVAAGLCGKTNHLGLHMNRDDIKAVYASGHEIGNHTYSHMDSSEVSLHDVLEDIDRNQAALDILDVPSCATFAYPYGELTPALKEALGMRFRGARGIHSQTHTRTVDLNQIGSNRLYHGTDFDLLMSQIADLNDHPGWMTIFSHDVRDNPSAFGCTPAQMRAVITAVQESGADVMTVAGAIDYLEAQI